MLRIYFNLPHCRLSIHEPLYGFFNNDSNFAPLVRKKSTNTAAQNIKSDVNWGGHVVFWKAICGQLLKMTAVTQYLGWMLPTL
jgi:hypothetical protein